ncbi:hypothetical protein L2E82_10740 [Cichorium intybus]|uniref:Uncharacterized protein n=1 Tax=Cichorium intybus TaxID=13427 RepID=A0ACB9GCE2_CICIN|nr:hypothetical protein L2E82_10740 [Cichorium intybus]
MIFKKSIVIRYYSSSKSPLRFTQEMEEQWRAYDGLFWMQVEHFCNWQGLSRISTHRLVLNMVTDYYKFPHVKVLPSEYTSKGLWSKFRAYSEMSISRR